MPMGDRKISLNHLVVSYEEGYKVQIVKAIKEMGFTVKIMPVVPLVIVEGDFTPETEVLLRQIEGVHDVGTVAILDRPQRYQA